MQSKNVLGIVLAFGVAFSLLAGSGVAADLFGANAEDADSTRAIEQISGDSDVDPENEDGGLDADVGGDNEPTLVGVAISGGQFAAGLVAAVALLPFTLIGLGFPAYFAIPVGGVAQIIAFVGLIQFVRGTEYL